LDGGSRLVSKIPVSGLIAAFQKTNHFSLLFACAPAENAPFGQRIISIAQPSGVADLVLRQDGTGLVFWFRNQISAGHAQLAWNIPDAFIPGQPRDILFSYDGSNLSLYMNGTKDPHVFVLGPGTRLAELIRRIKSAELEGYIYIYDALIFIPAGALLGIAVTRGDRRNIAEYIIVAVGFLWPPWLFERFLAQISGRSLSFTSIALCLILALAGSLWINSDRSPSVKPLSTDK
jgi:hypothetical protein